MANGDPAPDQWYQCPTCFEPLFDYEFCPRDGLKGQIIDFTHREIINRG